MLYDWNIEEGDTVILNENGELRKVLSGDWTQNCNSKNVDTTKFVNMMQVVKAGKQIDWICPFCGGKVERLRKNRDRMHIVRYADSNRKLNDFGL